MPTSITTAHKPMQQHYNYRLLCAQRASMAHKQIDISTTALFVTRTKESSLSANNAYASVTNLASTS